MNPPTNRPSDERLKEAAQRFRYPPTPDVTGAVLARLERGSRPRVRIERSRSAWAVIASFLLVAVVILFAVPGVRAEIVRFFQVGVVRIFPATPTPTGVPSMPQAPLTATPQPGDRPYGPAHEVTIADIAGKTSLEAAQAVLPFPVRLPAYPADLGRPDQVFLQEGGELVILVWFDPADPQKARLSLHEIESENILLKKFEPRVIQETQVNRQYAVWVEGPYLVQLTNGDINFRRTVEGNTLIWEEQGVTYRLETSLALEEAVKIAESLE